MYRVCRILRTPTEELWPGVSALPDYKSTFPKWKENILHESVKNIDDLGYDILQVKNLVVFRCVFQITILLNKLYAVSVTCHISVSFHIS